MGKVKPIPKKVLTDSIKLDGQVFDFVRVEPMEKQIQSIYGDSVDSRFILFVDYTNTPRFNELKDLLQIDTVVEYDKQFRTIVRVDTLKHFDNIHHLEVLMR